MPAAAADGDSVDRDPERAAMRVLFLHPNFPAHFRDLAPALAADPANEVVFATQERERSIPGIRKVSYGRSRDVREQTHPYLQATEESVLVGQGAYRAGLKLIEEGFVPDLVIAHSGWGQTLFLPDLFPKARFLGYFEWFYRPHGSNSDFLPDANVSIDEACRVRMRNSPILLDLVTCDWGIVSTPWQLQQFPEVFHPKLSVIHDGIDTDAFRPGPGQAFRTGALDLSGVDELVTYATRGLEPYRGFPAFMRAMELVLRRRPGAHVVIGGEDRAAYGSVPPGGGTWKEHLLSEVDLDPARVHFVGLLPPPQMLQLLQASAAHVYSTVPFIPSWSLFEAMSTGCLVIGSATPPVTELVVDGRNGLLFDFFDHQMLADRVCDVLADPGRFAPLRAAARALIVERFDVRAAVAAQLRLIDAVMDGTTAMPA
jgi:glycosyltransferase involved in cell wall biosynthesis